MKHKNIFLIFITVILSFFLLQAYPLSFKKPIFTLNVKKDKALNTAKDFLTAQGYFLKGYKQSLIFKENRFLSYVLQDTKKINKFYGKHKDRLNIWSWDIRFLNPESKEGFRISVNPESGKITDFRHISKKNQTKPNISKKDLEKKAFAFLKNPYIGIEDLKQTDYEIDKNNKAVISYFPAINPSGFKNISLKYEIIFNNGVIENFSTNISAANFKEDFAKKNRLNSVFSGASLILTMFIIAIGLVILTKDCEILYWKNPLILASAAALPAAAAFLNNIPSIWMTYNMSLSKNVFLAFSAIMTLFWIILMLCVFFIIFTVGFNLAEFTFKKNLIHFLKNFSFLKTRKFRDKIITGYFTGGIILLFSFLFYFLFKKYVKIQVLTDVIYIKALSGKFSFIVPAVIGIFTAFFEEFVYRAAAVSVLKRFLKFTIPAVIIASLIWAASHITLEVFPFWIRIIEIFFIGIILSLIFFKHGIESAITAHFFYNSFLTSVFFIYSGLELSGYISITLIFIPLAVVLFNKG